MAAMIVNGSKRNEQPLQRTFHRCFLPSFKSFGQAVSEEKLFQKSTNKKQEMPMTAKFVNGSKRNEQFLQRTFHRCFLPRFGPFGQAVSDRRFLEIDQSETKMACGGHFINGSGRNEQSLQRTCQRYFLQSFGSFVQAVSEEKICLNRPIRNKNCVWWPCLLID